MYKIEKGTHVNPWVSQQLKLLLVQLFIERLLEMEKVNYLNPFPKEY